MGPLVILVIVVTAVLTASLGTAWGQMLEARQRASVMDLIKTAMLAGKEPPREVLDELARVGQRRPPWTEVIAFTALAAGFWIACVKVEDPGPSTAFFVVASSISVAALGLFILALTGSRGGSSRARDGE